MSKNCSRYNLFINTNPLIIYCMEDFKFKIFGIILVYHEASNNALEKFFVDAAGGYMVDDCVHVLHKVVGVPIIIVMNEESDTNSQCQPLIGILETNIEHCTEIE